MANVNIFGIIISKLRYEKKPCPVILLKVDKDLDVGFYHAILLFGLIVHLWVKDGGESSLNTKKIA